MGSQLVRVGYPVTGSVGGMCAARAPGHVISQDERGAVSLEGEGPILLRAHIRSSSNVVHQRRKELLGRALVASVRGQCARGHETRELAPRIR